MLSSTAFGVPRFSITRDRRSSSTRRRSFPKFARAFKAETTIPPFLPAVAKVDIHSPVRISELYCSAGDAVNTVRPDGAEEPLLARSLVHFAGHLHPAQPIHIFGDAAVERLGNA